MATTALSMPGPVIAVIMIAVSTAGKAWVKSAVRMMRWSRMPSRRTEAASPSAVPSTMPMPTAPSPTASELRAPTMIIEKTSRPNWSVPNQFVAEGPLRRLRIAICVG